MIPTTPRLSAMVAAVLILTVLTPTSATYAQSGGGFDLSWHTVDGGGAASAGATYALAGTIGQADAGVRASGGTFKLSGGFWAAAGVPAPAPTATTTQAASATPTVTATPGGAATTTVLVTTTPTAAPTGGAQPTTTFAPVPTATPTPLRDVATAHKCALAIAKSSAAFTQAEITALQQCEAKIIAGKLSGVCPDDDPKTQAKLAAASQKLKSAIGKACGGKNKLCSPTDTGPDADLLRSDVGLPSTCPGFEGDCTAAVAESGCGDIATCLGCIGEAAAQEAIALYYDVIPADPKAEKSLNGCQQAIGKSAAKYFVATSKVLQGCWDKVSSGKLAGPCPDVVTAEPAIAKAAAQRDAAIAKACCGKNKACGVTDAGANVDFDPITEIGFPTSCDSVTIPGGASCDGTVADMQSLMACIDCVTEFKATCAAAAPLPMSIAPYPTECE